MIFNSRSGAYGIIFDFLIVNMGSCGIILIF